MKKPIKACLFFAVLLFAVTVGSSYAWLIHSANTTTEQAMGRLKIEAVALDGQIGDWDASQGDMVLRYALSNTASLSGLVEIRLRASVRFGGEGDADTAPYEMELPDGLMSIGLVPSYLSPVYLENQVSRDAPAIAWLQNTNYNSAKYGTYYCFMQPGTQVEVACNISLDLDESFDQAELILSADFYSVQYHTQAIEDELEIDFAKDCAVITGVLGMPGEGADARDIHARLLDLLAVDTDAYGEQETI